MVRKTLKGRRTLSGSSHACASGLPNHPRAAGLLLAGVMLHNGILKDDHPGYKGHPLDKYQALSAMLVSIGQASSACPRQGYSIAVAVWPSARRCVLGHKFFSEEPVISEIAVSEPLVVARSRKPPLVSERPPVMISRAIR